VNRRRQKNKLSGNAYRAPRDVTTVAPKLVTRTPHRSTAGTTEVDAIANIKFLTPLERGSVRTATNITNQNGQGQLMGKLWSTAGVKDNSRMGGHDLSAMCMYDIHIVRNDGRQNEVHLGLVGSC